MVRESFAQAKHERIFVLYASQTGNSEQAAIDICEQLPKKLSTPKCEFSARHMQLDDFLEMNRAHWTRLVVICLSSYGVGQAPLGGYRFREFCNALLESNNMMLEGLQFAILGLGDSKYTTFFQNPATVERALVHAGARRVGPLGKADASGTGSNGQIEVIGRWIDGIWPHLRAALDEPHIGKERLDQMHRDTFQWCIENNPDLAEEMEARKKSESNMKLFYLGCYLTCVAMLAGVYFHVITPQLSKQGGHDEF